ncbi:MAG: hypothetical protein AB7I50_00610 [Vicinamibacterales bacterium]
MTLVRMGTVGLGLLTIEGHMASERDLRALNPSWRLGVFLNGTERTFELTASDDRRGWVAGILKRYVPGRGWQAYLNERGDVARFALSGAVEYRLVST